MEALRDNLAEPEQRLAAALALIEVGEPDARALIADVSDGCLDLDFVAALKELSRKQDPSY